MASQGSGTVISSSGTILTNKHVIDGTVGCLVGFIDDYDDEPYFGDRQIADIDKISTDADIAILKLRNPNDKTIASIDITKGNSNTLRLGDTITTYGYPAMFGRKLTYTSGDFSGVDGDYLKTTAIIEYGNSGGGAYLKNGTFIGMPTAVVKGELNSIGFVLSINKINSWLDNSTLTYGDKSNNNYSRVSSILDDFDLSTLDSLDLFIPEEDADAKTQPSDQENRGENKNLSERVKGQILLQVESCGEAYYIYPDDTKKYYLGRPRDAFNVMRQLGLGATHEFITSHTIYPDHVLGKILLDVEDQGKAYYIYPKDKKAYYLGRPADAFKVMRELGLGITNSDLSKIPEGSL